MLDRRLPELEEAFADDSPEDVDHIREQISDIRDRLRAFDRDRLRSLLLPRQPRLHFRDERDNRKHKIIGTVLELDIRADIYVADLANGVVDARRRCLTALTIHALTQDIRQIVIERDDGMVHHDKRTIAAAIRSGAPADPFEYRWERAHDEPLLWIPDALAWCWAARSNWQADIRPIVTLHQV